MSDIYPASPSEIPENLTRPSSTYKKHAWLAVLGLAIFVLCYFSLSAWFGWTAYRLIGSAFTSDSNKLLGVLTGLPAAFLAVFMLKALFFVKRGHESEDIELTKDSEPKLFEFLYKLADEAGAPRPHRVYVSPRVNACVFYDLSILNLFFPSKKNLEIGLGLVNVLNLGELKAVLAHEFGHFAQKSMAVGSWVYIAHQIAGHIINQRDILDRFVMGVSRFDLRIAWVGWILRLVIWSIRSLMDTVFSLVVMAQRALSREMEFQADLVAVSLTGSDALINALHKLHAADEAWERSLAFMSSEAHDGRSVTDVFTIQHRTIKKLGIIFDDSSYGEAPELPERNRDKHRVFTKHLAAPPRMWATHPENSAREENAKKVYISAEIDKRTAWLIFEKPEAMREKMSVFLLDVDKLEKVEIKESIENLDKQFRKAYYSKNFRGAYLGRSITRYTDSATNLFDHYDVLAKGGDEKIDVALSALYPKSISVDLEKVKVLYDEKRTLEGIYSGNLKVSGGIIRHRGEELKRTELLSVISSVNSELVIAESALHKHDKQCRTVHLALAKRVGKGWEENLLGITGLLHYASHTEANLRDLQAYLSNIVTVITADDRITKKELNRLLVAANQTHAALQQVYLQAELTGLGDLLCKQLEVKSWQEGLGGFELCPADDENINEWMGAVDSWLNSTINALSSLNTAALEQLLKVESYLSKNYRNNVEASKMPNSPSAPHIPEKYTTLVEGQERKLQIKLGIWDQFYTASGFFPAVGRFIVAGSIVGAVIYVSYFTGSSTVTIYNGLANPAHVYVAGHQINVQPYTHQEIQLPANKDVQINTTINELIVESFPVKTGGGFSDYIYNIASAAPLVEWTQVYGDAQSRPNQDLGAPRWIPTSVDVLFEEPPESVNTKSNGSTKSVLSALGDYAPDEALEFVENENEREKMIQSHAAWDTSSSAFVLEWIYLAAQDKGFPSVLTQRLKNIKYDMIAMRLLQDTAEDKASYEIICQQHTQLAKENSNNANLQYLKIRCIADNEVKNKEYILGSQTWVDNRWFQNAAGYSYAELGDWREAEKSLTAAMKNNAYFKEILAPELLRLQRFRGDSDTSRSEILARSSRGLSRQLRLESGEGLDDSPYLFYSLLDKGDLTAASDRMREMEGGPGRSLRLLAASDGADSTLMDEALALPVDEGIDSSTLWISWSLVKNAGGTTTALERIAGEDFLGQDITLSILNKLSTNGVYTDLENDLKGMALMQRGYFYAAACVLLGQEAPKDWRIKAKNILFASERPYFSTF